MIKRRRNNGILREKKIKKILNPNVGYKYLVRLK